MDIIVFNLQFSIIYQLKCFAICEEIKKIIYEKCKFKNACLTNSMTSFIVFYQNIIYFPRVCKCFVAVWLSIILNVLNVGHVQQYFFKYIFLILCILGTFKGNYIIFNWYLVAVFTNSQFSFILYTLMSSFFYFQVVG